MRRTLAPVLLAALTLTPALASAAPGLVASAGEQLVLWARSDGTSGISTMSEFQMHSGLDDTQFCTGVAPLSNGCVLKDHTDFGDWTFGYALPNVGVTSFFAGSAGVNLTGTHHLDPNGWGVVEGAVSVYWGCNFWLAVVLGWYVGDYNCGWTSDSIVGNQLTGYPAGDLTATFTVGVFDGRYPGVYGLPTRGDTPGAVGPWAGVLIVRY